MIEIFLAFLSGVVASAWFLLFLVVKKKWRFEPPNEFRYECPEDACWFSCSGSDMEFIDRLATAHKEGSHD